MSWNQEKKEEDKGFNNPLDQEQLDNSSLEERIPEFDVIGTALNDL